MLLSYIIPVYNEQERVVRAVHSILKDSVLDAEVILVDDGSTDHTPEVCDLLSERDSRIRVLHTENQGQGFARNTAILQARGAYLAFCDADDYIEPEGIRQLCLLAEQHHTDVICGTYYRTENGKSIRVAENFRNGFVSRNGLAEEQKLYHRIKTESLFGYVWNKLYRREFLIQNQICFQDNRRIYFEDILFNLMVFSAYPVYYFANIPVYHYMVRADSCSQKCDAKMLDQCIQFIQAYGDFLKDENVYSENLDLMIPLIMRVMNWNLFKALAGSDKERFNEVLASFLKLDYVKQAFMQPESRKYLHLIPSYLQRIYYQICFDSLRHHCYTIRFLFRYGYPFMKWYVLKAVR